jgi:hypothetical protein
MATTNTLLGTSQADILNGPGSVVTRIDGLAGNDSITLALLDDEAYGGTGNDTILFQKVGSSLNTIDGGDGNDTIFIQSATTFGGNIAGGAGADSIAIGTAGSLATISSGFIRAGLGADTINLANVITTSTIGGGSGADLFQFTAGAAITSSYVYGGQQKDSIIFTGGGSMTSTSVNGGKGNDTIYVGTSGSNFTSTNALIGGGLGLDSISLGAGALATTSISGGGMADTITFTAALGGATNIYGDQVGETTAGTNVGNDFINGGSQVNQTTAISIYGAGGNDTIAVTALTSSQALLSGGDGADSIRIFSADAGGKINGGAGNDSITITNSGAVATQQLNRIDVGALGTLNGGAGTDTFFVGTGLVALAGMSVAATANSFTSSNMLVQYGAGDIINLGSAIVTTGGNWVAGGVYAFSTANVTATANMAGLADVGVYSDGTDSWLAIQTVAQTEESNVFTIRILGKDLTTTTLFGLQALRSSNFGFDVNYNTGTSGMSITLT